MTTVQPEPQNEGADPTKSMELVWQGQRGDAGAVNELFTRYIPRMRRVLNIKIPLHQRSQIDPDDLMQETLIVATLKLPELEVRSTSASSTGSPRSPTSRSASGQAYLRAERRNPAKEQRISQGDESDDGGGLQLPSSDPSPSQEFVRGEMEQLMDQQLQQLEPADYREVILQKDYYEADWETIRRKLERPTVEAVQDLYQRAHRRLQERLARFLR